VLTASPDDLEALLLEKDQAIQSLRVQAAQTPSPASTMNTLLHGTPEVKPPDVSAVPSFAAIPKYIQGEISPSPPMNSEATLYGSYPGPSRGSSTGEYSQIPHNGSLSGGSHIMNGANGGMHASASPAVITQGGASPLDIDDGDLEIRSWPPHLPPPDTTRRL
jgi:hypothetical protein